MLSIRIPGRGTPRAGLRSAYASSAQVVDVALVWAVAALLLIGIVMVKAARLLERRYPSQGMISRMSDVSYTLMVIMGMVIAIRAYLSTL